MDDILKINTDVKNEVIPKLVHLHKKKGYSVLDINFAVLGIVTKSLEVEIGSHEARKKIIACMDNVWPEPTPPTAESKF